MYIALRFQAKKRPLGLQQQPVAQISLSNDDKGPATACLSLTPCHHNFLSAPSSDGTTRDTSPHRHCHKKHDSLFQGNYHNNRGNITCLKANWDKSNSNINLCNQAPPAVNTKSNYFHKLVRLEKAKFLCQIPQILGIDHLSINCGSDSAAVQQSIAQGSHCHTLYSGVSGIEVSACAISGLSRRCQCLHRSLVAALPAASFKATDEISGSKLLVDTGACRSFVPKPKKSFNLAPYEGPTISTANGQPLKIYGTKLLQTKIDGKRYWWDFIVADVTTPIMGADFLIAHRLAVDMAGRRLIPTHTTPPPPSQKIPIMEQPSVSTTIVSSELQKIISDYQDVFSESLTVRKEVDRKHKMVHEIKTSGPPLRAKYRRLDPAKQEIAKEVFAELEMAGICQKAPSPWASPLHMVPKPDGSYRPCGDYRRLNVATEPDHYPLPNISDITNVLGGAKYFSKIDMLKGYFQVPVAKEDIPKTAIATPFGTYTFNYTCFGLRNAGATFQRLMDTIFGKLPFVVVYVDDILIFSRSLKEHLRHIRRVLQLLRENGLIVKPSKCVWATPTLEFLGHTVSDRGMSPLPSKVKAVREFPIPSTVRKLQEFNGIVNFYHRFIPGLAEKMAPLYDALKDKPKKLMWNPSLQAAFEATKNALANAATLAYPTKSGKLVLKTDASDSAIGAVLEQDNRPIAFFSRKLSEREKKYAALDRELLAVHRAFRHFHHLLEERNFICQTDHQPLVHALVKPKDQWTGRRQRQFSEIATYKCTMVYIKGKNNTIADALSRNPINDDESEEKEVVAAVQLGISYQELAEAQANTEELQNLFKSTKLKWLSQDVGGHTLWCETSTGRPRPYVPPTFREKIFKLAHSLSHPSARSTTSIISERYIWPNMRSEIKKRCRECDSCQRTKISRHTETGVGEFKVSSKRLIHLHADVVGPLPPSRGYKYLLTIIDRNSRWVEAFPMTSQTAESCASALIQWISRYGLPETLVTDRGANFTSSLWKEISHRLGFELKHTTAYNPECNGIIERFHRSLKSALTAACQGHDWVRALPWVLLGLRSTPHSALGAAPAEALYGQNLRLPLDLLSDVTEYRTIEEIREDIESFIPPRRTYNPEARTQYRPPHLESCPFVFERIDHHKPPLSPSYEGPFPVLERREKTIKVNKNGKEIWLSMDRVKAAFISPISEEVGES